MDIPERQHGQHVAIDIDKQSPPVEHLHTKEGASDKTPAACKQQGERQDQATECKEHCLHVHDPCGFLHYEDWTAHSLTHLWSCTTLTRHRGTLQTPHLLS